MPSQHHRRLRRTVHPLRRYASKFTGESPDITQRPSVRAILVAWAGAFAGLAILGWLAEHSHTPLIMAPFGASVVLLFARPDSDMTQPRNVVGGHMLGALIGMTTVVWGEGWLAVAMAVAAVIALGKATRTLHPPAGATAIVAMQGHGGWIFLLTPVLSGSVLLVGWAALYNNLIEHRRYPRAWI